jgi:hypothetical protein
MTPEAEAKVEPNDSTIESSTNEEALKTSTEKTVSDFLNLCKADALRQELALHESKIESLLEMAPKDFTSPAISSGNILFPIQYSKSMANLDSLLRTKTADQDESEEEEVSPKKTLFCSMRHEELDYGLCYQSRCLDVRQVDFA